MSDSPPMTEARLAEIEKRAADSREPGGNELFHAALRLISRFDVPDLIGEIRRQRETIASLNRRAQSAEKGVMAKVQAVGPPGLGRAAANSAARIYKARAEAAEAELAQLRAGKVKP